MVSNLRTLTNDELLRYCRDPRYHLDNPFFLELLNRIEQLQINDDILSNIRENLDSIRESHKEMSTAFDEFISQIENSTG